MENNKDNKQKNKTSKTAIWVAIVSFVITISALAILIGFLTSDVSSSEFHPGLPELKLSIATFIGTLISFAIVFLLTWKFLWGPMTKHLDKRRDNIQNNISEAEKTNKKANELFGIARIEVERSKAVSKELYEEAKKEASTAKRDILSKANEESKNILQSAREQIEIEKKMMDEDIKREILETSMIAATKIIEKEINSSDNTRMIEELIDELRG